MLLHFFFMMIALGVLAFYAIQYASQAGWSPYYLELWKVLHTYLLPGALIVISNCCTLGIGHIIYLFGWIQNVVAS